MTALAPPAPLGPMARVTARRPCPACGKADWCLLTADGRRGICPRVESPHRAGDAGWLHVYDEGPDGDRPSHRPPPPTPTEPPADWRFVAEGFAARLTAPRADELAAALGLPAACVDAVPLVGWDAADPLGPCWTLPEWDAAGRVVGLMRRFVRPVEVDGRWKNKLLVRGGRRGLTLPHDWRAGPGPLLVVEGASDVLAAAAAGLTAVGRPSSDGGAGLLAAILADGRHPRPVVVMGENDRKPDGRWPGGEGAARVAARLKAAGVPALVRFPPPGAKDVREWVAAAAGGGPHG